jgi:hypothetical protein
MVSSVEDLDTEIHSSVLRPIIQTMDTYASEDIAASKEVRGVSISTVEAIVQSDPDSGICKAAIQQICEFLDHGKSSSLNLLCLL